MVPVAGLALSEALPDPPADGDGQRSSTILIIEDDATVRAVVRRHLEADGYRVLEAVDGHSGLDLIETHGGQLDLVLTDIDMPRIDGVTVAEVLAALRPLLGVICMSAGIAESRFVEGLALRPQPFLAKPFTRETLAQVLAAEIARSRELAARLQGGEDRQPRRCNGRRAAGRGGGGSSRCRSASAAPPYAGMARPPRASIGRRMPAAARSHPRGSDEAIGARGTSPGDSMTILMAVAIVLITLALAPGTYRFLKGWRASRRSAWELDRAAWRLWMDRP